MPVYPGITALFARLFSSCAEERRILMVGVDAGGKTTLLYRLKLGEIVTTIPTIGFNVESVQVPIEGGKRFQMTVWDVGGCDKIRPLWRHYFQNTQGLILMHDSTDREVLPELVSECARLMDEFNQPEYGGVRVPFLVFANKQDLPNAFSAIELQRSLTARLPTRPHPIATFPLSAIAPADELYEQVLPAFTWLDNCIRNPNVMVELALPVTVVVPLPAKEETKPFDPRSPELLAERLESWIIRASNDSSPEELLEQFKNYTLPAWDHYTHIRIAYVILTIHGRQKGKNMIFDGIESYIKNSTQSTGRTFHLTMTYFWIQIVHYGIASMSPSSNLTNTPADAFMMFLILNPHTCDGMLWNDYYEKSTIMNVKAKEEMVLPDKKPLPSVVQREAPPKLIKKK